MPAPLTGAATIVVNWTASGPTLALDIAPGSVVLADLLPETTLGSLGQVGASNVVLHLDESGITGSAQMVAAGIPGLEQLNLDSVALPVTFSSPGFGPWSSGQLDPITLTLPLGDLAPHGSWNTSRTGAVAITLASNPVVGYEETLTARLGGDEVVFTGAGTVGDGGLDIALRMDGEWVAPFGASWLTMRDIELDAGGATSGQAASIRGGYTLAGKSGTLEFSMQDGAGGTNASVSGTLDDLVAADLTAIAQSVAGSNLLPSGMTLPNDVLAFRNVAVSFSTDQGGRSLSLAATTEVLGQVADAALSVIPAGDGTYTTVVAVQPRDVSLAGLFPVLEGNEIVGDLRLPNSAFVFTGRDIRADASTFDPTMASYLGATGGEIRLPSGISLTGTIPAGVAPAIDDMKSALGMDPSAPLRLSGTIPVGALTGSGGDFVLDATLPPMSPDGSPEWFVSAELGFRITSQPSVGVVGSMTLDMQGDVQTFEIEASVAREPAGISVNFVGRLANPWESPFNVEWLTLNEVVLKLGMEPARGVTIGFLGDIVVGSKDLRGAMSITVSPAGAPTNFIFEAASEEGISLGDMADLYAAMSGKARPRVEKVLPAVEIRDIELRFAPEGDPDLGVEQGFKIAGELWMASSVGGPLELIVATDVEISDAGVFADGFLTDFALGVVEFDETTVSVEVSAEQQRIAFSGGITIAGSGVEVALDVGRTEMAFRTTGTFGDSEATLEVAATYDLTNPGWRVRAIMNEEFIQDVDAATEALLGEKFSDLNSQIKTAESGLSAAQGLLSGAQKSLRVAQGAVNVSGCKRPFANLCKKVESARKDVARRQAQVTQAQEKLAAGKALLEKYDIQLTIVGAEFEAAFSALGSNTVTMDLMVDANGRQVPVPIEWDFDKTIDANVDGLLDQLVAV